MWPSTLAGMFCLFEACYFSFFAVGLAISPNFFFGPDTPLIMTAHFATPFDDKTILFARFFAGTALSLIWAPFLISVPYEKWYKLLLINGVLLQLNYTWGLFIADPAFTHGGLLIPMIMWYSEYMLNFFLLAINIYIVKDVKKGGTDMV